MKWLISTMLMLFSTILGPYAAPAPEPVPQPPPEPAPIVAPAPEPEPVPQPEPVPEPEPENTKLYVLMYHHFVPEGEYCNAWTVTGDRFREDLQWLAEHGYETVLPSRLAAGEPLPRRAVLLTFDDGYDSNYRIAYPLLQEFGAKAAISLIVSYVDDPELDYLTWDMCREMAQSGLVEFGSHTYACHDAGESGIKRLKDETREEYEARVLADLQTSIDQITQQVGTAPQFFAYPNGKTDKWAAAFIREHFPVTVNSRHGSNDLSNGLQELKRYNVEMGKPVQKLLPD